LTEDPFEVRGEFMGDYNGSAAFAGRVYGVWTELGNPPLPPAKKDEPQRPQPHTVVRVGVADFNAGGGGK